MRRVVWLPRSRADLEDIGNYVAADNPTAARELVQRIIARGESLVHQPHLGRPGRLVGTRELVITGTSYIVPYWLPRRDIVEILAVFHGAREWPKGFQRK